MGLAQPSRSCCLSRRRPACSASQGGLPAAAQGGPALTDHTALLPMPRPCCLQLPAGRPAAAAQGGAVLAGTDAAGPAVEGCRQQPLLYRHRPSRQGPGGGCSQRASFGWPRCDASGQAPRNVRAQGCAGLAPPACRTNPPRLCCNRVGGKWRGACRARGAAAQPSACASQGAGLLSRMDPQSPKWCLTSLTFFLLLLSLLLRRTCCRRAAGAAAGGAGVSHGQHRGHARRCPRGARPHAGELCAATGVRHQRCSHCPNTAQRCWHHAATSACFVAEWPACVHPRRHGCWPSAAVCFVLPKRGSAACLGESPQPLAAALGASCLHSRSTRVCFAACHVRTYPDLQRQAAAGQAAQVCDRAGRHFLPGRPAGGCSPLGPQGSMPPASASQSSATVC